MFKILFCSISLCFLCTQVMAMTITSDAPGNIFAAGSPIKLSINDAKGEIDYEVVDYFDGKIAAGKTAGKVELPALDPGWYQIKCRDSVEEATTSIGVVINRGNAPLSIDGRVCTDVAGAWLVNQERFKSLARMIKITGIPWVRERLSWGGTQKQDGTLRWNKYQTIADDYAAEGVNICQMWHDAPKWVKSSRGSVCPDDLRDYYKFARDASTHFSRQIKAWEICNEPDAGIPSSDLYAGMIKAAYLGLKTGNPKATVLIGSICRGVTNFLQGLYESGCTDYFDVFNWHIYSKPSIYPGALAAQLDELKKYNADDRPVWLTEAGVVVKGTEGPAKRILNSDNQRIQCRFIPRAAAMALAGGTDKYFFFVLPDYTEGDTQWGALYPDLTPYPSFIALSASANLIGESIYKGEYKPGNRAVTAQVFSTPQGNVMVVWSDTEAEIAVPTDRKTVRIANIFGKESSIGSENGAVKVKVGPEAIYLLDIGKPVEKKLTGKPRPIGKLPKLNPSRIVIVGHCGQTIMKNADAYMISGKDAFDFDVDVYNFNEKSEVSGTVELVAPRGWIVEKAKRSVALGIMGRESLVFRVKPDKPVMGRFKLIVLGKFGSENVSPSVSTFTFNPADLAPTQHKPLDWAKDAASWYPEASTNGSVKIDNPESGILRFDMNFNGIGDRWAYPILQFAKPLDMSGFDGLAFDLNVANDLPNTLIRLMLVESGGAHYISTIPAKAGKYRVVFLFKNMERLEFMGADDNGHLDLDAVAKVKLGCNAGQKDLSFSVSDFELVKYD